MFRSLRKTFVTMGATLMLTFVPIAAPVAVYAADLGIGNNLACGSNFDTKETGCDSATVAGTDRVNKIVTTVVNIFSIVVGIVAVIMIIVGGFKYITSGGDSNSITSAKNTIIYALIGLVIVALAQFIVQFVLNKVNTP